MLEKVTVITTHVCTLVVIFLSYYVRLKICTRRWRAHTEGVQRDNLEARSDSKFEFKYAELQHREPYLKATDSIYEHTYKMMIQL